MHLGCRRVFRRVKLYANVRGHSSGGPSELSAVSSPFNDLYSPQSLFSPVPSSLLTFRLSVSLVAESCARIVGFLTLLGCLSPKGVGNEGCASRHSCDYARRESWPLLMAVTVVEALPVYARHSGAVRQQGNSSSGGHWRRCRSDVFCWDVGTRKHATHIDLGPYRLRTFESSVPQAFHETTF